VKQVPRAVFKRTVTGNPIKNENATRPEPKARRWVMLLFFLVFSGALDAPRKREVSVCLCYSSNTAGGAQQLFPKKDAALRQNRQTG
jgi:hypothetical protein